jgi:hypothetical protein
MIMVSRRQLLSKADGARVAHPPGSVDDHAYQFGVSPTRAARRLPRGGRMPPEG